MKYIGQELEIFKNAVNWRKYWSKIIESEIKGNVLEVGSGMGTVTDELKNSSFESWVSIEPDFSLLSTTNSTLRGKVELVNGTSSSIKGREYFDTILYIDVLEHIENDMTELQVINKTLKLGGSIVILSPAYNFLFNDLLDKYLLELNSDKQIPIIYMIPIYILLFVSIFLININNIF